MNDAPPEPRSHAGVWVDGASELFDFSDLAVTPAAHFKLCWFGAVMQVARCAREALGSADDVLRDFPFVREYVAQLEQRGAEWTDPHVTECWWASLTTWEAGATMHLPLRAVRLGIGGGWNVIGALLSAGLQEDDPRLGALFARMQGGTITQPTVGFLNACWNSGGTGPVRRLQEWGLVSVTPGRDSRHTWTVQVAPWVWDAVTEGSTRTSGVGWSFEPTEDRIDRDDALVLPDDTRRALAALPDLVRAAAVGCIVVRGPRASGRTSLLRELAANVARGLLTFSPTLKADDERWAQIGPIATLLGALPVAEFDLAPGETMRVPHLPGLDCPLVVILGKRGGIAGPGSERAITLELAMPASASRRTLWQRLIPKADPRMLDTWATQHRMPAGRLVQLGRRAIARAALDGRERPELDDVAAAANAMHTEEMGSLASVLPAGGTWDDLALPADLLSELRAVESRCRHRECLAAEDHRFAPNAGVRALFTGPSGTGKTLAVRVLGSALGRAVYRVDLSAVVNKYIGETEKNLDRVLSLAEELDVVLLFDEGDALLARRTAVQTSNDRYANLETNFLLQRLESFDGIVFITTNAGERVDSAFQRRMDAVVEFRLPEIAERRRLWELHLPRANSVDPLLLDRLAGQCSLTGGQIRNAALHARLLALDEGSIVNDELLTLAVRREYRKSDGVCPLRLR